MEKLSIFVISIAMFCCQSFVDCTQVNYNCNDSNSVILCETTGLINNTLSYILQRMESKQNIQLMPGLELVQTNVPEYQKRSGGNTVLSKLMDYLNTHYLKVDFSNFLQRDQLKRMLVLFEKEKENVWQTEARKKDKGGGYLLMSALMFGKMMAAMGFGGVSMLALKALGISMMALMLSSLLGLKKLTEGGHDSSAHHVQYVTADHHRRRRNTLVNPYAVYEQQQQHTKFI